MKNVHFDEVEVDATTDSADPLDIATKQVIDDGTEA
jgi:hypothetical protein